MPVLTEAYESMIYIPEPLQVRRIVAGPLGNFQGAIYFAYFWVQVVICGSLGFHRDYEELLEPC